jgi:hypothetical protein
MNLRVNRKQISKNQPKITLKFKKMTIKMKKMPSLETENPHKISFAKQIANSTLKTWTKQVAFENLTNQLQKESH